MTKKKKHVFLLFLGERKPSQYKSYLIMVPREGGSTKFEITKNVQ